MQDCLVESLCFHGSTRGKNQFRGSFNRKPRRKIPTGFNKSEAVLRNSFRKRLKTQVKLATGATKSCQQATRKTGLAWGRETRIVGRWTAGYRHRNSTINRLACCYGNAGAGSYISDFPHTLYAATTACIPVRDVAAGNNRTTRYNGLVSRPEASLRANRCQRTAGRRTAGRRARRTTTSIARRSNCGTNQYRENGDTGSETVHISSPELSMNNCVSKKYATWII